MHHRRVARLTPEVLGNLVRAAHAGEPQALDKLLLAIRPPLVRFFARRISPSVSEDLAQIALMRIVDAIDRIEPERADQYLMTVAHNLLRTEFRRRARDARRQLSLDYAADIEAPIALHDDVEHNELTLAIRRASLDALPPPLRDIVLALLGGLSPTEVAERLCINPVTLRTRLLRARGLLRRELCCYIVTDADDHEAVEGDGGRQADSQPARH